MEYGIVASPNAKPGNSVHKVELQFHNLSSNFSHSEYLRACFIKILISSKKYSTCRNKKKIVWERLKNKFIIIVKYKTFIQMSEL
jgi:hypothetical protein